jgi:peptide deformylase
MVPSNNGLDLLFEVCFDEFMIHTILEDNSPTLFQRSEEITVESAEEIEQLISDMFETLELGGVGLSAIQIGIKKRIFVISYMNEKMAFVNPVLMPAVGAQLVYGNEGCLSRPGIEVKMRRWDKVVITSQDKSKNPSQKTLKGFMARIAQHEYDHLNGKVIGLKGPLTKTE